MDDFFDFQGKYDAAEPLCRQCLAIDEKTLGEAHPYVADDLASLASALQLQVNFTAFLF